MAIEPQEYYDFCDLLIRPDSTISSTAKSRADVELELEYEMPYSTRKFKGIPIMSSNMLSTGNFSMAKALLEMGCAATLHKYYDNNEYVDFFKTLSDEEKDRVFFTIGLNDLDKYLSVAKELDYWPNLNIDVANGHSIYFLESLIRITKELRSLTTQPIIMAGNVATANGYRRLCKYVDIVKMGIGSGALCETRRVTGVGVPQASMLAEANKFRQVAYICSDGGIVEIGDFAKAFGLGADFVMVGSMFASRKEGNGFTYKDHHGLEKREIFGMSSTIAMETLGKGKSDYKTSEGRHLEVIVQGPIKELLQDIFGGIRSACTYVGFDALHDLIWKGATLIPVRRQLNESLLT